MENKDEIKLTSDEVTLLSYMSILNHLSIDLKLKLIAKLSESITFDFKKTTVESEPPSWKSLAGVWADMDDDLADRVRAARLPNRDILNFDS